MIRVVAVVCGGWGHGGTRETRVSAWAVDGREITRKNSERMVPEHAPPRTSDTDDDRATLRGRPTSHSRPTRYHAAVKPPVIDASKTRRDSVSSTSGSSGRHRLQPMRISFTRSKSPLPPTKTRKKETNFMT